MTQPHTPFTPRDATKYDLEWEAVDGGDAISTRDTLGLTADDRKALGMTAPRTVDLAPFAVGEASDALREAISRAEFFDARTAGAHAKRRQSR